MKTCSECGNKMHRLYAADGRFICEKCYGKNFRVVHPSIDLESYKKGDNHVRRKQKRN